ncbi:MAG: hypothetical protein UV28_C0003G0028 [Candidatus Collierbacteria bacterium GW2011_GWE2_42_48]|nr:MAG: hypothetical protein UV28_C0003G0028 [Candidatus Collierbacteria bacterium GW2011_GWE2_42_48]
MTLGLGEAEIEGVGDSEVSFIVIYLETRVYLGIVSENLVRIVRRSIVNGDYFEVGIGLVAKAFKSLHKILSGVVDRR